jgi:hypothetical protein
MGLPVTGISTMNCTAIPELETASCNLFKKLRLNMTIFFTYIILDDRPGEIIH